MGRVQWFVVLYVSFIHFIAFAHRMEVVPFFTDLKDTYQTGYAEIGGLVSAFLLGYAVFQIPAGTLADRYSPKRLILIGLLIMLSTSFLFTVTHSLLLSLFLRFLMGASSAMLFSPGIKLISSFTPKEKRGMSIGILEAAAGMGMLLTLTIFPILSVYIEWNLLFVVLTIILLPVIALFGKVPGENQPVNEGQLERSKMPFLTLLKNPKVLRLMGIAFFGLFGLYGFIAWLPTYLETSIGYSKQETGIIMAVTMVSQVIMAPVSGKLSDWMGQRKATLIYGSFLMTISSLWLLLFHNMGIYFVAVLIGTGISWSMAPMLTLATEVVSVNKAGSVISIMNTVGQLASAISGFVYGMMYDWFGDFQMVWLGCLIAFVIRILFCLGDLENKRAIEQTDRKEVST
ncbi:MFS transporter [Fictibacillus sp. WQ 8-8]|uniref:MFS transporter n=1 Tax=Fictibacillus sp. WQ 8-8 TaxID=2938788 RepID=UPI00210D1B6A|nr:MFS transporter [Fictibacillus sp. WQ 8-8]MCQ6268360.1 MFS transporter [Fictibacillus sp. WQ 8-8]